MPAYPSPWGSELCDLDRLAGLSREPNGCAAQLWSLVGGPHLYERHKGTGLMPPHKGVRVLYPGTIASCDLPLALTHDKPGEITRT